MKKLLAILLSAILVASMCCVFVSAEGEGEGEGEGTPVVPDYSTKPFWVTHYDDVYAEAAGVIMTTDYTDCQWNYHIAFAPVEGTNAFEVVEIMDGTGAGTATPIAIPDGGFVYVINRGNNYQDLYDADPATYGWCNGMPNYENPGCQASLDMVTTWAIGDKFAFEGIDLEGKTVPTTTPDVLWYNDADDGDEFEYVCTATVTPYVSYDETEYVSDETTGDLGYYVAYGFTFAIDYVDGSIVGEDNTIITSDDAYAACNPNWAISVLLQATEDGLYEVVGAPVVTPGSPEAAGLTVGEGQLILVAHSSYSRPVEGFDNWSAKIAAMALKEGDKVYINDDMTEVYVLMPGEVIDTGNEDEEMTLEEALAALIGEPNPDALFDVVLEGPESYKAGDDVTITATIKNIAEGYGLHSISFDLSFDYDQLEFVGAVNSDNSLDIVTKTPSVGEWENLSVLNNVETGNPYISVAVFTTDVTPDSAVNEDGELVLTFKFKALDDASEDTGAFTVPDTLQGIMNTENGEEELLGNLAYVVVEYDDGTGEDKPTPGDATNMIVFAVLALVAIAGSAVVIKSRR